MLVWQSSYFVRCSVQNNNNNNNDNNNEEKVIITEKSYAHSVFTSLVSGISVVCRRYYGLIIRGHFGLRDLFFF